MLNRLIILILGIFSFSFDVSAQGTVRGKVTDTNGEALIGVTVVVKSNTSLGAATDFDGNYSIKLKDASPVILLVTYMGFSNIEETVSVENGEVLVRNFTMKSSSIEVKEVEVSAKAVRTTNYYMESMKKQSSTTIDYVSSETMKKTGDNNVTSAISRVTGVSNTAAGFITVRGIGDRYVRTTVNGSLIPTLDPFTNNIRLDFIPANLVDNIIITKTASPDLAGNWAGAYISVETKDYPEQLTVAAETQFGYNTQATFRDVLSGERSKTDWLGFDNSLRDRDNSVFYSYYDIPNQVKFSEFQYEQLAALGLREFYANLGVTSNWDQNSDFGKEMLKLGLVELGILSPAFFNDQTKIDEALLVFDRDYAPTAFAALNANAVEQNKRFSNSWLIGQRRAPLNFSQSFGVGNQLPMGKSGALGYLFGMRYSSSNQFDEDAFFNRPRIDQFGTVDQNSFLARQALARELNTWSALAKLNFKLSNNHSIGFLFMPNFTGQNSMRYIQGFGRFEDQPDALYTSQDQFYEERRQLVYQVKSEHFIPAVKLKVQADASYTDGYGNIPDFRTFGTSLYADGKFLSGVSDAPNTRDFRYLEEDIFDAHLSFELPVNDKPGKARKVKWGGAYTTLQRDFNQYQYILGANGYPTGSYPIDPANVEGFLASQNFEIRTDTVDGLPKPYANLFYVQTDYPGNRTVGNSQLFAYYAMLDYSIDFRWRVSGGLRVEHVNVFGDIFAYDSAGYVPDDPRRNFDGFLSNPGEVSTTKFLPSLNVIFKIKDDETGSTNLRANYSRTAAYPSIRELTPNNVLDFELRTIVFGNPNLKPVDIDNIDFRWEKYYKDGSSVSASYFHKFFKNHIELVNFENATTWQNVKTPPRPVLTLSEGVGSFFKTFYDKVFMENAVAGLEVEGVKKFINSPGIIRNLELRANIAFIKSETFAVIERRDSIGNLVPSDTLYRPMFGQAPYLINFIASYNFERLKSTVALSYNLQGPKLVFAATEFVPNIFEMPRNLLDVKVTKELGEHFTASFTIRDVFNQPIRRKYDLNNDQDVDFDSFRWGTNFNIGLTYKL